MGLRLKILINQMMKRLIVLRRYTEYKKYDVKMGGICKVTDNGGSFCIVIAFKGYKY